jgi:DNA polymerase-3 subunit beta
MGDTSESRLHLRADRERLLAAIQAADAVVQTTSSKPILTHVQIEAVDQRVELTATDQQVGLRATITGVEVVSGGTVAVPSRHLAMVMKESSSPAVELEVVQTGDAHQLAIRLGDGDYLLPMAVGEGLPPVSTFPAEAVANGLAGRRFDHMLRQTAFAMDKDRASPVLSGMLVSVAAGELCFAATDGKVLAESVEKDGAIRVPEGGETFQAVLPSSTVQHLQRIVGTGQPERVQLAFAGRVAFIRLKLSGDLIVELTSRLVDGAFPAYRMAIGSSAPTAVTFATGELASAVRRVSLMVTSANRAVVLELSAGKAVLSNMPGTTGGNARIPVNCQYAGNTLRMGLNAQYMGEVLRVYGQERIAIELGRGLIMREPGATYLVMPIALPS